MSRSLRNGVTRSLTACLALVLGSWATSTAFRAVAQTTGSGGSSLRLYARLENWDRQLQTLDESTLKSVTASPALQLGSPGGYQPSTVLASGDGGTVAAVAYKPMPSGITEAQARQAITVRVIDARTGMTRADFHPAVPTWIQGISHDGSELFGWRVTTGVKQNHEWEVLRSSDGKVTESVSVNAGCCAQTLYDPAHDRLYGLEESAGPQSSTGLPTPVLLSYDLRSGGAAGRLALDGIQAGSAAPAQPGTDPMLTMWNPGFALNPDGSRIAVLDGQSDRLELIDTAQMHVARAVELTRSQGLLERIGHTLGLLPAPVSAKEWVGAELSISFSLNGQKLYVTGRQGKIGADGAWSVDGLGLRLVDLATGQIVADALAGQWVTRVMPSADGSVLYTESQPPMGGSPAVLRRQDAASLAVKAERTFYDAPELYLLTQPSPGALSWLQSWPMPGHDSQRTNRGSASGPLLPHLLFERKGLYPEIVAPDGTIYAGSAKGLVALKPGGKRRWVARECCGDGEPVLAPNGMLLSSGFRHGTPATQGDTEALGLHQDGSVAWRIQPFGVLKGAVPLVDASSRLYLPVVGPEGVPAQGLNILSSDGKLLQKLPRAYNLALSPDGTVVALTDMRLQAFKPDGSELWHRSLNGQAESVSGPMVGTNGTVYVGDGSQLDAFGPNGTLLWQRTKTDGALALAERSDGAVLVAGRNALDAFEPDGSHLWQTAIGVSRAAFLPERPKLIVDRDGTAYVGSGDGLVRIVSIGGEYTGAFDAGGRHHHDVPGLLLDGSGRLIVTGTDGAMRVYGS